MNRFNIISNAKAIVDQTWTIKRIVDNFDNWQETRQNDFIVNQIQSILEYSSKHTIYYKKLFNDYAVKPKDIKSIDDLKKIPVLTKDIIRTQNENLRSDEIKKLNYTVRRSGGTTGEPIASYLTKEARAFETFVYLRGLSKLGWRPEMTFVKVFGGSLGIDSSKSFRSRVYDYMMNSIFIPAFEIDEQNILKYHKILSDQKQNCLIGYASAINNLVDVLKKKNLQLDNVSLVITTSEQLIEDWKLNIEDYLNCPVRSYYGCGEIGSLGYQQLGKNEAYYVPRDHVVISTDEKTDELIITQLHNKAQPLIRYKNGDVGFISNDYRKIEKLLGRTADMFIRSDGTKVSSIFGTYSIQKSNVPVSKYQYIQHPDLSIEFLYRIDNQELGKEHKEIIRRIIENVMNERVELKFTETENFIISNSGKHRICVKL